MRKSVLLAALSRGCAADSEDLVSGFVASISAETLRVVELPALS